MCLLIHTPDYVNSRLCMYANLLHTLWLYNILLFKNCLLLLPLKRFKAFSTEHISKKYKSNQSIWFVLMGSPSCCYPCPFSWFASVGCALRWMGKAKRKWLFVQPDSISWRKLQQFASFDNYLSDPRRYLYRQDSRVLVAMWRPVSYAFCSMMSIVSVAAC